jgi:hypothetical protein
VDAVAAGEADYAPGGRALTSEVGFGAVDASLGADPAGGRRSSKEVARAGRGERREYSPGTCSVPVTPADVGGTVSGMASGDKVNLALDAEMVERARQQLGEPAAGLDDAAMVERALNAYLLRRLIDSTQVGSDLTAEDAERIAYEELHALRRERRDAA